MRIHEERVNPLSGIGCFLVMAQLARALVQGSYGGRLDILFARPAAHRDGAADNDREFLEPRQQQRLTGHRLVPAQIPLEPIEGVESAIDRDSFSQAGAE